MSERRVASEPLSDITMRVVYSGEQRQWLQSRAPGYFACLNVYGKAARYARQQADIFYTIWPTLHSLNGTPLTSPTMVKKKVFDWFHNYRDRNTIPVSEQSPQPKSLANDDTTDTDSEMHDELKQEIRESLPRRLRHRLARYSRQTDYTFHVLATGPPVDGTSSPSTFVLHRVAMKNAPTFQAFHKRYNDQVRRPWFEYANAVEQHRVKTKRQDTLTNIDENDKPLLPEYNHRWSMATIADILTSYLDDMWFVSHGRSPMHQTAPWDEIRDSPDDYVCPEGLPNEFSTFCPPFEMTPVQLIAIYDHIRQVQAGSADLIPLKIQDPTGNGTESATTACDKRNALLRKNNLERDNEYDRIHKWTAEINGGQSNDLEGTPRAVAETDHTGSSQPEARTDTMSETIEASSMRLLSSGKRGRQQLREESSELYSESEDIDQLDVTDSRDTSESPQDKADAVEVEVDLTEDQPPAKKAPADRAEKYA
ncbi:hypothetical protein JB92DRAFT_2860745 [Gautieria morchelliformis]|nr:hypothetical protein JB92DRAFT_2860745 [Gautieria morchelliformis]